MSYVLGCVSNVRMTRIIDIVSYASPVPYHAIGVPARRRLVAAEVIHPSEPDISGETGAMNRAFVPIRRLRRVHALQHILLAARRPIDGNDVIAQQPSRRPESLCFRHLRAYLKPS